MTCGAISKHRLAGRSDPASTQRAVLESKGISVCSLITSGRFVAVWKRLLGTKTSQETRTMMLLGFNKRSKKLRSALTLLGVQKQSVACWCSTINDHIRSHRTSSSPHGRNPPPPALHSEQSQCCAEPSQWGKMDPVSEV